jgi:dicarboxylate transporter 10
MIPRLTMKDILVNLSSSLRESLDSVSLYFTPNAQSLQQLTIVQSVLYGSTRFAMYESIKDRVSSRSGSSPGVLVLIPAAAISGFTGGFVGNAADIANVRMQNDKSLPHEARRNYRHVVDAIVRVGKEEGWRSYFRGVWPNCIRAAVMTSSQLASYDAFKTLLVRKLELRDVASTHLMASIMASLVATTLGSPVDVVKTKLMSASGQTSVLWIFRGMYQAEGFGWLFRGWLPSFVRLGPQTIATLLFLEQHKRVYRILTGRPEIQ